MHGARMGHFLQTTLPFFALDKLDKHKPQDTESDATASAKNHSNQKYGTENAKLNAVELVFKFGNPGSD